ncbi:hypothetical protein Daus18300_013111 [Diaporthe australafricana]|uniref:Helicase ATP-binding domain-containing protein n=1 Tax=Diaporthe australafricana TaxID=127596 RepID=A0ABR3W0I3_9PEZI
MSLPKAPVQDMDLCPPDFGKLKHQIGWVDLQLTAKSSHDLLHHLLFERPCGEGAVPPNLLDKYDQADEGQKATIAYKYAGKGYGIDAYIVQLRMQTAYGIKMDNGLHQRVREIQKMKTTAAFTIWNLAHHHFGQVPDSDLKVKGAILWLMHGQEAVDKIPDNTMEGLQGLAAKIAYPLMFQRTETALIMPIALYGTGPAIEKFTWKKVSLPLDKIPTLHRWDGSVKLEDLLGSKLTRNLALDFPDLTQPPGTGIIMSRFNKPLLIPIRYECSRERALPMTIQHMRSFTLQDWTPALSGPNGIQPSETRDVHYDLCAVVNLKTDDVRLYGPRTVPLTERPPPDGDDSGQQRDTGVWNLGDKETNFLLWYLRIDLKDGETYMPSCEDAPEFRSVQEVGNRLQAVGAEPGLRIERPPDDDACEQTTMSTATLSTATMSIATMPSSTNKAGEQPTMSTTPMPPSTKKALRKLIKDNRVLGELRKFADPSQPYTFPVFLHGQPLMGNSSKYPVAMGLIDPAARIVSIQPTDQAASWASQHARHWAPKTITIGHVPLWNKFDAKTIVHDRISFVSARQMLGHGLEILAGAAIIVIDEVHHQPIDHELAIAQVRHWVKEGALAKVRIVLMSSYLPFTSSSTPLIPNLSHVELEGSQLVKQMGHCTFGQGTSEVTTRDSFISFAKDVLHQRINLDDGPVLIIIPDSSYITKLLYHLKSEGIAKRSEKGGKTSTKWQITQFLNMGETFSADDIDKFPMGGKSVVISPPWFDKCRREIVDVRFKHVICPHWMTDNRYDKVLGRDVPCSALLSKSEMCFLAFQAKLAWLTCTRDTWEGASDRDSAEAERVAPTEYLIKAAKLFPGLIPYEESDKAMPLRIFPAGHRTCWSLQQLGYSALTEMVDLDDNGVVLSDAGEAAVGYMLEMGLRLRGSTFLHRIVDLDIMASNDTESCSLSLLYLAIPLAVSMGQGHPVLQYKWNAESDAKRLESLDFMVKEACKDLKVPDLPGYRRYGDDLLQAWLLVRYLVSGGHHTASTNWVVTIPKHLQNMVAHIRRSVDATKFEVDRPYTAFTEGMAENMDKRLSTTMTSSLMEEFQQCIYSVGLMNLALVEGRDTSHGKAIGHAVNINGGAPVLLSQGSTLNMGELNDRVYVTFDRIETVPRDEDTGATRMISGLSPVTVDIMSLTHVNYTPLDSWDPQKDSLRSIVEYPFQIFEM